MRSSDGSLRFRSISAAKYALNSRIAAIVGSSGALRSA